MDEEIEKLSKKKFALVSGVSDRKED